MAIIDPEGLFNGDRLRRCSNAAQLHFVRLLVASNGFGRLEINYARIIGTAYVSFNPPPSETELQSWIREYAENSLLFLYEADGRLWGQWDTNPKFLPRFKTAADHRSPTPPELQLTAWKRRYRSEIKAFPKCFRNISETFPSGVGVGVGVGKTICASDDARLGEALRIDDEDPPFGTRLEAFPPEVEAQQNNAAGKTENCRTTKPKAAHGGLTAEQEIWWAEFWDEYPRKRARKAARQAFAKAIKTEALFRQIMVALRAQKPEMLQREPAKRPYAATWLNGERWEDEIETKPPTPVNGPASQYTYTPPTNLLTDDQIAAERARKTRSDGDPKCVVII